MRRGLKSMLDIYPALITAYENVVADCKTTLVVRTKVNGFLEKLKSFKVFYMTIKS